MRHQKSNIWLNVGIISVLITSMTNIGVTIYTSSNNTKAINHQIKTTYLQRKYDILSKSLDEVVELNKSVLNTPMRTAGQKYEDYQEGLGDAFMSHLNAYEKIITIYESNKHLIKNEVNKLDMKALEVKILALDSSISKAKNDSDSTNTVGDVFYSNIREIYERYKLQCDYREKVEETIRQEIEDIELEFF